MKLYTGSTNLHFIDIEKPRGLSMIVLSLSPRPSLFCLGYQLRVSSMGYKFLGHSGMLDFQRRLNTTTTKQQLHYVGLFRGCLLMTRLRGGFCYVPSVERVRGRSSRHSSSLQRISLNQYTENQRRLDFR